MIEFCGAVGIMCLTISAEITTHFLWEIAITDGMSTSIGKLYTGILIFGHALYLTILWIGLKEKNKL